MRFILSNIVSSKVYCWWYNDVIGKLSEYYYTHKKTHYECCVCGRIIAPYFDDKNKYSLTTEMGWHKLKGCNRYICHHCADHGFVHSNRKDEPIIQRGFTYDEWLDLVEKENARIIKIIKNKDLDYYNYWLSDDPGWFKDEVKKFNDCTN